MVTGAACVVGAIWFTTQLPSVRKVMRPIYLEMGIIPGQPELEERTATQ
jgi:hypothetical protein